MPKTLEILFAPGLNLAERPPRGDRLWVDRAVPSGRPGKCTLHPIPIHAIAATIRSALFLGALCFLRRVGPGDGQDYVARQTAFGYWKAQIDFEQFAIRVA